jgi:uncharacterized protein DUF1543
MAKLFMLLVGAKPSGRHTEQHDVFFGIGDSIRDILPQAEAFWPEAVDGMHLDAWREVTNVDGYAIRVLSEPSYKSDIQLFFINLGGYKKGEFEEFHYKMITAAPGKGEAIQQAKNTAFFKHTGFKGATSHVDDKYGVDVDDIYAIADILPASLKERYSLHIEMPAQPIDDDTVHLGYFNLDTVDKWAPL